MRLFFFIPTAHLPNKDQSDDWVNGRMPVMTRGKTATALNWLYQTWLELRNISDVHLVSDLPESGLIITMSNFLGTGFRASSRQFIAAVAADYLPHSGAHVQLVQNAAHLHRLPGAIFMPLWPQPSLIPRNPLRGATMETVAFLGDSKNLAPKLRSPEFSERLKRETGATLELREIARWHDYSDVDAVLAIRDFSSLKHLHKPGTKLINAWLAGVPLIGGRESSFAAIGKEGRDYLIARSVNHSIAIVQRLRDDHCLYGRIVEEGKKSSIPFARTAVVNRWKSFCNEVFPNLYRRWQTKSPLERNLYWLRQRGLLYLDRKLRS